MQLIVVISKRIQRKINLIEHAFQFLKTCTANCSFLQQLMQYFDANSV